MNIGIDIDDTFVSYLKTDNKYNLEFVKKYNIPYKFINGKDIKDGITFDWTDETLKLFWQDSFGKNHYKYAKITTQNKQIIKTLKKDGHKIYFISARNPKWYNLTINWLDKNKIEYDGLILTKDKVSACKELKIDIFVDDNLEDCKKIQTVGINTFQYKPKINNKDLSSGTINYLNDLIKITKHKGEKENEIVR